MRPLTRLLKTLLFALIGASALAIAAALILLRWPGLVITERTLPWAARMLDRSTGVKATWKDAYLDVESLSFLEKRIALSFAGLCLKKEPDHACFREVSLEAVLDFSGFRLRLVELGPARVLGGMVDYRIPADEEGEAPAREEPGPERPVIRIPARLIQARVLPIRIELERILVREGPQGEDLYQGGLELRAADGPGGSPIGQLELRARLPGGKEHLRVKADFRVRSERKTHYLDHELQASYVDSENHLTLRTRGSAGADGLRERLDWEWKGFAGGDPVPRLSPRISGTGCELDFLPTLTRFHCPVRIPIPVPPREWPRLHIPAHATVAVSAELNPMSFPPDPERPVQGSLRLTLDPVLTPFLEGEGRLHSRISGIPARFPHDWVLDTELGIEARIPRFERLVERLGTTQWAIPAPFHVMRGTLGLQTSGHADLLGGELPLSFRTRLQSTNQRLNIDALARLRLPGLGGLIEPASAPTFDLRGKVVLTDVRLELPRLQLEAPPPILPDPRIHPERWFQKRLRRASGEAPPTLAYDIEVVTPEDRPLTLISNLAKEPVPLRLRVRLKDDKPPVGHLALERFPLQVFRRKAFLESFDLALSSPVETSPLDGRLRVFYTDYVISILLLGTAGTPRIRFVSDPPLPEDQIASVLLFGRPLEELDPDQSASVGSARSALADGALGLASLYVLASTPVQSIGYNPATSEFSMKFRLGAGTSLNVGSTSGEFREIGIRKRLGPHWTITTDLTHRSIDPGAADASSSSQRTASAFLEWHNRY